MRKVRYLFIWILIGFLTACSSSEKPKQVDAIFNAFITPGTPGGAVAIFQNDRIVYEAGYGLADIEQRIPMTPQHIFQPGSIGKQFTAMTVMILDEQGKLDYDDPVSKYLPELAHLGEGVTIRRLLHHTSGLTRNFHGGDLDDELLKKTQQPTNRDLLALLSERAELEFQPGATYWYSNPGHQALASVVERMSGQPFHVFLKENIFDPLGMVNTFSAADPRRLSDPSMCHGYLYNASGLLELYEIDPFLGLEGAAPVYTTLEDMYRYDQALYTEKMVEQSTLAEARRPLVLNNGREYPYGFARQVGTYLGQPYKAHSGGWLGFRSYYIRFPEKHLSVVLFLNFSFMPHGQDQWSPIEPELLGLQIARIYLK
ncbi:MAG: serine hydrolase domain-containing protein [Chloroflexota bacterium]